MLSEEQLEIISEALTPLFDYLEHEVIVDIARRVGKTMELTRTAELQAMELKKLGYSPNEIRKRAMQILNADVSFKNAVEKNTIESKKEIKGIIDDIVTKAKESGDEIVASAGDMSWIDDMRIWESNGDKLDNNSYLSELVTAMQMQTGEEILNLSKTTGFKTMSGIEGVETLYRTELNKALIKVTSGTFSANTVVQDVVHNLAHNGLRSIDYASGRTMQLDTAVRLAVRTGAHQLSGQIAKQNINDTGVNLVYVAEHENARNKGVGIPNHEEWQGKVYLIQGDSKTYQDEADRIGQDSIKDLWEETGYSLDGRHENNPLGLYGYNCRHIFYPWFEGASELPEKLKPRPTIEYNGKTMDGYAQTQELRRQEANIRRLKREKEALKSLGLPTTEINAKISERTREYKEFCTSCGVPQNTTKLRYECGTSDLKKTDAWKRFEAEKKNVLTVPEINGEEIDFSQLDLSDNDDFTRNAYWFLNNSPMERDTSIKTAFEYNIDEDVIKYNDTHDKFDLYDKDIAYAHEVVHRMDLRVYDSIGNNKFCEAITNAGKQYGKDLQLLQVVLDKFPQNMFLQDIFSFIYKDNQNVSLTFGHWHDYWTSSVTPREIFADLGTLKLIDKDALIFIEQNMKEVYDTFMEIISI